MSKDQGASLVLTCHCPYPPAGGAALRNWQNINALRNRGEVDVVSVGVEESGSVIPGVRHWKTFSWRQILDTLSFSELIRRRLWPLRPGVHPSIDFYRHPLVASWLRSRLKDFTYDFAIVEELFMAGYAPILKDSGCRVVYDAHNIESLLYNDLDEALATGGQGLRARLRQKRIRDEEARIVDSADFIWTCSEDDREGMASAFGRSEGVSVVPNAVDVTAYRSSRTTTPDSDWSELPPTIVFMGSYAYQPNLMAARFLCEEVFPRLRERDPGSRLVIVGRNPSHDLVEASQRAEGIEVTGEVRDVLPYLEQPCVVVTPLSIGGGTRLKILEAFAAGRPVVSSRKGAEGILVEDGRHLFLREEPDEIVQAVTALWKDPDMRSRMVTEAINLVEHSYSWSTAAQEIECSLGSEGRSLPGDLVVDAKENR